MVQLAIEYVPRRSDCMHGAAGHKICAPQVSLPLPKERTIGTLLDTRYQLEPAYDKQTHKILQVTVYLNKADLLYSLYTHDTIYIVQAQPVVICLITCAHLWSMHFKCILSHCSTEHEKV